MAERAVLNVADRVKPAVFVKPAPRQVYRFEAGGKTFAYDANAMTLAVGGGGDEEWASPFRPDFPHPPIRDHADTLVLCLTRACNLRCQYCFVRKGDGAPGARMTPDMARRALDLLLPPHGPATVAFFGGEPLLEWGLLTEIVEYARHVYRGPGRPGFHLTTNGTPLDAGKAAFLDREGFDLIVSLDGPRDIHNQSRPGGAGVDSYEATLRGLKLLKGLRLAARTTLRGTFAASGMRLRERLEHHHRLLDEGLAAHVSLEPASLTESACGAAAPGHPLSFDSPTADWGAVEAEYGQAAGYLRDRIRPRRAASFEPLVRFARRLAFRQAACSECQAGNGTVSVAPDGRVCACHREGPSAVGSLAAGGLEESLRAPWLDPRFYLNARCLDCPIRLACGGPCRLDALERGDLHTPSDAGCKLRHIAFRWAAWLLSELTRDEAARLAGQRASTCCGQKT
ncbi:MAG TPA: radical SAM protein [Planctomycetota bacterium]|nr:radical SAM protein [Planctomycetota bacterium]HRR81963.1 radical SAM protein [Planctomycetota bacterium]HRT96678.1 radical SAM protein [Planctomycetota bacterium]